MTLSLGKQLPLAVNEWQMQLGRERAANQQRKGRGQGHPGQPLPLSGIAVLGRGNFLEEKPFLVGRKWPDILAASPTVRLGAPGRVSGQPFISLLLSCPLHPGCAGMPRPSFPADAAHLTPLFSQAGFKIHQRGTGKEKESTGLWLSQADAGFSAVSKQVPLPAVLSCKGGIQGMSAERLQP